jgi:hypothetical protein
LAIEVHKLVDVSDMAAARDLVVAALSSDSCRVKVENSNRLTAKRGSQAKMRTLGGAFVNLKVLPVRLEIDFVEIDNAGQVKIFAASDLGVGLMLGSAVGSGVGSMDGGDVGTGVGSGVGGVELFRGTWSRPQSSRRGEVLVWVTCCLSRRR